MIAAFGKADPILIASKVASVSTVDIEDISGTFFSVMDLYGFVIVVESRFYNSLCLLTSPKKQNTNIQSSRNPSISLRRFSVSDVAHLL